MDKTASLAKAKAFALQTSVDYAQDAVVSKTLVKKQAGSITLFAFDAGQALSEHTSPFDAVVQVLDGEAEITIDGRPQSVSAGEMLIMPAGIAHALSAKTPFKMLLVMIREK